MTLALDRPSTAATGEPCADLPRRLVPRALFLPKIMDAHALWRAVWPCASLTSRGYVADFCAGEVAHPFTSLIESGRYNIVVTPRITFSGEHAEAEWQDLLRAEDLCWAYELDDDILSPSVVEHQMRVFSKAWQVGHDQLEHERQMRLRMLRQVDAVIASTEGIAQVARQHTDRPVYVIPNAIHAGWMLERLRATERQLPVLTVGWAGGAREPRDLEPVAEAWRRVARARPDVTFVVFGERMGVLMDAIPKGQHRRVFIPWVDVDDFPRGLVNIDIACCSVADTAWNACRSPDKLWEHTLAGGACVVSPALYGPHVRDGHDALVAETPDDWERAILRLVDSPRLRWELNRNALGAIARNHTMFSTWPLWLTTLADVLARRGTPS